jgi:hypothetical protein
MTLQAEPGLIGPMDRLVAAGELGARGVFASAMAGYVRWLAGRRDAEDGGARFAKRRTPRLDEACSGGHARLAGGVGGLFDGWLSLLDFAAEVGAIGDGEAEDFYVRGVQAFASNAGDQKAEAAGEEESGRFMRLIYAALDSGRAHLAGRKGDVPPQPERYGWRNMPNSSTTYEPLGACVGWVDGGEVFLDPEAAYAAGHAVATSQQMQMTITQGTLWKRLAQHGLIKTRDTERRRNTVRKTLGGVRRDVLHLVWRDGGEEEADSADHDGGA